MMLVVDIGNSNIAAGLWKDGSWKDHWRFSTEPGRTEDEHLILFRSALSSAMVDPAAVDAVVVSTVVPDLEEVFDGVARKLCGRPMALVRPWHLAGLTLGIENPNEIGTDLVANAVAGYAKYRSACIIVDFGTALTFTAVGPAGRIEGVSIAPGMGTAVKSLAGATARLPHVKLEPPAAAIGRNTVASIQSGILYGYAGLVEHIVERMRKELGAATVLFTGGYSTVLAGLSSCHDVVEPWLTLDGLRLIAHAEFGLDGGT